MSSQESPGSAETFDYVIVGAGSAGCALAERLTADGRFSVLLLEAGEADRHHWIHIPLGIGKMINGTRYVWPYTTEPEAELKGQRVYFPRGKVLGGSSSINGMVYVRGPSYAYDRWRDAGCPGWGWEDVLPVFRRMEHREGGDPAYRGTGGPISIVDVPHRDALTDAFYNACVEYGLPANPDYNGATYGGVGYLQTNIRNGRRCSSAAAYLGRARGRANLKVQTEARGTGIVIEGNRATGITYRLADGSSRRAEARAEVILCAGPITSPHLLELSGIGDPAVLKGAGIAPVRNLPGVGANLQDHLQVRISYECRLPITINDTLNSKVRGMKAGLQYLLTRRGLLATGSVTVHAIGNEVPDDRTPNVKLQLAHVSGANRFAISEGSGVDPFPGFTIGAFNLYPRSRGHIHARTADPMDQPAIVANYLSDEHDLAVTKAGLRMTRGVAAQPALKAITVREVLPGPRVASDDELEAYVRETAQTCWHQVGTCRMGGDAGAVVDPRFRVHGVVGLRVADSSVMPHLVASNTNAPSMMIGERCADMILQDAAG
jgi:choline dehydrogenase